MTFGEKLKKLRHEKGLSQPELAELTGIEQSYLSKLENDKSLPSNDIFRKLLSAFSISLESFIAEFEAKYLNEKLSSIADVEYLLKQQSASLMKKQRSYLYTCSFLIVLSITMFYTGFSQLLFNNIQYQYYSSGVVLDGEPKDIFQNWRNLIKEPNHISSTREDREKKVELTNTKRLEMEKRKDLQYQLVDDFVGRTFVAEVVGGKRLYKFDKEIEYTNLINAWLQIIGVLLFVSGLMGFVLEQKFFSPMTK